MNKKIVVMVITGIMIFSGFIILFQNSVSNNSNINNVINDTTGNTPYYNDTAGFKYYNYTLPNYNPMLKDLGNAIHRSGYHGQLPTLINWRGHDGVYYINTSNDLVDYNISTGKVNYVAHIIPLNTSYQVYFEADASPFYAPVGFNIIYMYGQDTLNTSRYSLEQVNLSTGQVYMFNTTNVFNAQNQQYFYLGHSIYYMVEANNDSQVAVYIYNLKFINNDLTTAFYQDNYLDGDIQSNFTFEQGNAYYIPADHRWLNVGDDNNANSFYWLYGVNISRVYSVTSSNYTDRPLTISQVFYFIQKVVYNPNVETPSFVNGLQVDYSNMTAT